MVQPARVDDEGLVRCEHGEVGGVATLDAALLLQPGYPGWAFGHPTQGVDEGVTAEPGLGPNGRQGPLQRRDAPPGWTELADLAALELHGAWGMVGDNAVDVAAVECCPQLLPVVSFPDRRTTLELRGAVGDRLGLEEQVVRACLHRDRHPIATRGADHRDSVGAGWGRQGKPGLG